MKKKNKIAKERIQLGIQFLDAHQIDWSSHINLDRLDLSQEKECVLGQIFGDYEDAIENLGIHPRIARQMGFEGSITISNKRLTRLWKKVIIELFSLPENATTVTKPIKKAALKKPLPKKTGKIIVKTS